MKQEILTRLEAVNQLALSEEEKASVLAFFSEREEEIALLAEQDTETVERMVHVLPVLTVVREDAVSQPFSREDLQAGAPETDEGYWCVPHVLE